MSDNPKVAEAATQKNTIALDALVLLGTFGTEEDRRALVRHATGRVQKVEPGERVGGARVVAIGKDSIHLQSRGRVRKLEMPLG